MRCFAVNEDRVLPSISVNYTPYPHIPVGEEGRGRTLVRFPVAQKFASTLDQRDGWAEVKRGSILRTREKKTLLLVEERDPLDRRVLVLVDIAAGYRGSTKWTGINGGFAPCLCRGKDLGIFDRETTPEGDRCIYCGILLEEYGNYLHYHPHSGNSYQYEPFPSQGVTVLAEGYRAQGEAGRMGGHAVRLLVMEPGACFRVVRFGRLYGAPAERIVYWDGENLRLGEYNEVFPPACETPEGDLI